MTSDEQALRALHAGWIAAANAGDLEHLLTLMTDDVVFLNPGLEPVGRDGFADRFTGGHRQFDLRCISELEELEVAGEIAWTRCRDTLSLRPRAGGKTQALAGHRMTIYRQQADGRSLLARDVHTLSPVAD
jgi:uncharacterized protein (TIGR02246 family)